MVGQRRGTRQAILTTGRSTTGSAVFVAMVESPGSRAYMKDMGINGFRMMLRRVIQNHNMKVSEQAWTRVINWN